MDSIICYTDPTAYTEVMLPTHRAKLPSLKHHPPWVCTYAEYLGCPFNRYPPQLCHRLFSRLLVSSAKSCFNLKYPPSVDKYQTHHTLHPTIPRTARTPACHMLLSSMSPGIFRVPVGISRSSPTSRIPSKAFTVLLYNSPSFLLYAL